MQTVQTFLFPVCECFSIILFSFFNKIVRHVIEEKQVQLAKIHPLKLHCLSSLSPLQASAAGWEKETACFLLSSLKSNFNLDLRSDMGRWGSEDGSF